MERLDELESRVSVLEGLVGARATPFAADDGVTNVRKRILSLQLSVIGMRRQLEKLIDDRSAQGTTVAAIAAHLGVKPPVQPDDGD
ncbi:hypothetical protein [Nocardia sp. NPDC057030]|uniref:hypothetical protein n=1 Tax=unclassified Nocardia TaxID=2637762 RepID=UPI0036263CD0